MDLSSGVILNDANTNVSLIDGEYVFRRTQDVTDDFLTNLDDQRAASANRPTGDLHFAGSIPNVVVEQWLADGFNIFDPNVTLKDIFARIRRENMERLIGTTKTLS
jgi:hypothetical protein